MNGVIELQSVLSCLLLLSGTEFVTVQAADWTQFRGPNHNGISDETIRTDWTQNPPPLLWKVPLDPALSSFTVAGGRAFTQTRRSVAGRDREFCIALNADTGAELWAADVEMADYPNGGVGEDDGPRSTPSIDGDRVYVLTSYLWVICLDAATGRKIWGRDLYTEIGSRVIAWQNAASPLIVGDLIFLNSNAPNQRLMALDKETGQTVWKGHDDPMTQATPVYATIASVPQVIFFAQSGLVAVAPSDGSVLWRYPFSYSTSTAASPVVAGDLVYCSAAYGVGAGTVRISKAADAPLRADEVWRRRGDHMNHWATPVHHDGYVYGVFGQSILSIRCIELATGTEQWREPGIGYGNVLFVSGHLLFTSDRGALILVKPNPAAYTESARFDAVTGKCWNVAAINGGRIYLRSTTEGAAYDVAPTPVPISPLKLQLAPAPQPDVFRFEIGRQDGSPLDSSRAAKIDVFTSTDLGLDSAGWTRLDLAPNLVNGQLRIEVPLTDSQPQLFFRSQERP